jgi:mannose-6-phosphate isomerase-like protein (cupin superfamily)
MKPIKPGERVVRNLLSERFRSFDTPGIVYEGLSHLPLDEGRPVGTGFHVIRMEPGAISTAHEHTADEMFYVLEGELIDHDGTRYRRGEMVLLRAGTQHSSHTPGGCTLLVYVETLERPVD